MQNRQLWILNAVLAGIVVLLVLRLGSDWKRGQERYLELAKRSAGTPAIQVIPASDRPSLPVGEVVSKNLFTPERSNDQSQEVAPQLAAALPVVIGTMRLGEDYEALMAEAGGAEPQRFRRVKAGEQVGRYTVVEIRDEAVVVEFQGQRTVLNVYQSARSVVRAAGNPVPVAPRATAAPVVESATVPPPSAAVAAPRTPPPANLGATSSSIGDVKVTIEGNRRRYERTSLFGPQVWYEDIK